MEIAAGIDCGTIGRAAGRDKETAIVDERGVARHATGPNKNTAMVSRGIGSHAVVHYPHFTVLIDRFTVHHGRVGEQCAARTEIDAGILGGKGHVSARTKFNRTA